MEPCMDLPVLLRWSPRRNHLLLKRKAAKGCEARERHERKRCSLVELAWGAEHLQHCQGIILAVVGEVDRGS